MMSKEQERKALNEIKEILLQLEPDGYVRTAFEGCFEIAEDNINNDFACSMKQRAESAEKKSQELFKAVEQQKAELERMNGINSELRRDMDGITQALDAERKNNAECRKYSNDLEQDIANLEAKIVRLKAQVYDLVFKEGEE